MRYRASSAHFLARWRLIRQRSLALRIQIRHRVFHEPSRCSGTCGTPETAARERRVAESVASRSEARVPAITACQHERSACRSEACACALRPSADRTSASRLVVGATGPRENCRAGPAANAQSGCHARGAQDRRRRAQGGRRPSRANGFFCSTACAAGRARQERNAAAHPRSRSSRGRGRVGLDRAPSAPTGPAVRRRPPVPGGCRSVGRLRCS